jgi:hypothetical protein
MVVAEQQRCLVEAGFRRGKAQQETVARTGSKGAPGLPHNGKCCTVSPDKGRSQNEGGIGAIADLHPERGTLPEADATEVDFRWDDFQRAF